MQDDRELRERFTELRREDQAQAGEYRAFLQRARARANPPRLSRWLAVAASLALVIVAVVMSRERLERRSRMPGVSITEWQSPTGFLLNTPGEEMLQNIPQIGEWPASGTIPLGTGNSPGIRNKKSLPKIFPKENRS